MMARMDAESTRPIDDSAPLREFPKCGLPLVYVGGIYGKAVYWTPNYDLRCSQSRSTSSPKPPGAPAS